ncbi:MAG: histidine kinase [Saprospiraceae bacterium]|nr:histidine kinase [Saprospiraceae bacterium]MCB9319651.1 histidine kinase [Lewinellaceae bacterium]
MSRTYSVLLEVLIHILFWGLTSWLILSSFSIESIEYTIDQGVERMQIVRNPEIIHKLVVTLILSALLFYGNAFSILRFYHAGKVRKMLFSSLLIIAGIFGLQSLAIRTFPFFNGPALHNQVNWAILAFYFIVSTGYALGRIVWQATLDQKSLLLEKKQAELNALRLQLQPHFLFNALNNLLAMVDQQRNPALAGAIDQLSHLLRHVVDTQNPIVVSQEIDFIRNYIQIQLLRYAEKEVNFDLQVLGTNDQQLVEPGIFIPFVENAFKHGTEPETRSSISALFDLRNINQIFFRISNPNFRHGSSGNGTGLNDIRRRLELLYPDQYILDIEENEEYIVKLTICTHEGNHR